MEIYTSQLSLQQGKDAPISGQNERATCFAKKIAQKLEASLIQLLSFVHKNQADIMTHNEFSRSISEPIAIGFQTRCPLCLQSKQEVFHKCLRGRVRFHADVNAGRAPSVRPLRQIEQESLNGDALAHARKSGHDPHRTIASSLAYGHDLTRQGGHLLDAPGLDGILTKR